MEEYLNSLKKDIDYECYAYIIKYSQYIWNDWLYLEIHCSKNFTNAELDHVKSVLKAWTYVSAPYSDSRGIPRSGTYTFMIKNIEQEIRKYGLKELIKCTS